MIVDSMTYDEIIKLFEEQEKPVILRKIEKVGKDYRKISRNRRNTERVYFKPIRYESTRGFHVVINCYDEGINFPRHKRLGVFYYAWFRKKRGIHLLTYSRLENSIWHYSVYLPHFFDRYNERFLKDPTLSKPEIIDKYYFNNLKSATMRLRVESAKYPNDYWMACNNGLCLCNNPKGFFVEVKTFISWDMLGQDQQEFALEGKAHALKHGFDLDVPEEDFNSYEIE